MDNYLNILRLDVDGSDRVYNTTNLSLNQCSNNNRVVLYYDPETEYSYITMSFRQPDGSLTKQLPLIFDVDGEGYKYAYYDIDPSITSFIMGGRNAILTANIYFGRTVNGQGYKSTAGNIRINVNYVDDALINTDITTSEIVDMYTLIGALQNDFNQFKTGDIQVGSALMDSNNNVIHQHYETKGDARDKFDTLDEKKLDKTAIQDQTQRLTALETNVSTSNTKVSNLETSLTSNTELTNQNKTDIENLKETTVSESEFDAAINERKAAEVNLQSQIDGLNQSSVFKDMVDTASKLSSYDKSKLVEGDRILVLADSIIYKWTGTEFERVGKYGSATYTKSEIDAQHNSITNSIPNKATLANGELKLSRGNIPVSTETVKLKTVNNESIWGEGNIVIPVDTEFSQTSTNPVENKLITNALIQKVDVDDFNTLKSTVNDKASKIELAEKQDKLTAGANIKIENGIISASAAISLKKVEYENLEDIPYDQRSNNIIYLYKPVNEDTYSEYLYIPEEDRFEPFGEAGLHLEKYYTMLQVDELLSEKVDINDFDALERRVERNTGDIATKADATTTSQSINNLNSAVLNLQSAVATKVDTSEITRIESEYARKDSVPEAYQEVLKSGLNIKTINGVSILGSGDLGVVDHLTDLSVYYTKAEADPKFALKTELFDKDYYKLNNTPDLNVYRLISDSYTKQEVDEAIAAADISDRLTDYYVKSEVDELIQNVDISEELKDYSKKEYVDEEVSKINSALDDRITKTEASTTYISQTTALSFATKDDLRNEINQIPVPPSKTSQIVNDSGYLDQAALSKVNVSVLKNDVGYATTQTLNTELSKKQDKLTSGTNIKTINGSSILGSGDIKIVTDVSHLETKTDATSKLKEAKDYTDRTNATTLSSAKSYTDTTIRDIIEDTEGALEAIKEIKDQIGGDGVNILSSINQNKNDITLLRTDLSTEINNRTSGDSALNLRVDNLNSSFESHKTSANNSLIDLNNKITAEAATRQAEDENIYSVIDSFTSQTDTKIVNVEGTVNELAGRLNSAQTDINDHKNQADKRFSELDTKVGTKILFKNWVS